MKQGIHPEFIQTKVNCQGCGTTFETMSTVPEITVEICSNCHPFYTGKQKLVDTAGRVDRFRALSEKAAQKRKKTKLKKTRLVDDKADKPAEIKPRLKDKTVETKSTVVKTGSNDK